MRERLENRQKWSSYIAKLIRRKGKGKGEKFREQMQCSALCIVLLTCITDECVAELTTPKCWICYHDEVDKSECLRRDCSCRGPDAGFVHLSCLVSYPLK